MKRKKLILLFSIIVAIIICFKFYMKEVYLNPVANAIMNDLDAFGTKNTPKKMDLSDYTSFDWDRVLIFNYPTSNIDIDDALGIPCDVGTDLTNGMIFAKDDSIVHMEYFDFDYNTIGKFIIYPHEDIGFPPHYLLLSRENAIFVGERNEHEKDGYVYYRLYPSQAK